MVDLAQYPYVAYLPLAIVLVGYFGRVSFGPIPTALLAFVIGTLLGWTTKVNSADNLRSSTHLIHPYCPVFAGSEMVSHLGDVLPFLGVVLPVAITVAIGTIQCVESAEHAGDAFSTRDSMLIDGLGTLIAALFGSFLGMTVYIGHPAFKEMGARSGYSLMNAACFLIICFFGLAAPLLAVITLVSVEPVVIFVGLIIGADTLEMTPKRHYAAFLFGLLPLVSQWGDTTISSALSDAYQLGYSNYFQQLNAQYNLSSTLNLTLHTLSFNDIVEHNLAGFNYIGTRNLGLGGLLESIVVTSMFIFLIDRRFAKAAAWSLVAAFLAFWGLINSPNLGWRVSEDDVGWKFAVGYASMGGLFGMLYVALQRGWWAGSVGAEVMDEEEVRRMAKDRIAITTSADANA